MHDRRLLAFLRSLLSKIPSLGIFLRRLLSSENRLLLSESRLRSSENRFPSDETYFLLCKRGQSFFLCMVAQLLPSLVGEGLGVGSVIFGRCSIIQTPPLPLPLKGGEWLRTIS